MLEDVLGNPQHEEFSALQFFSNMTSSPSLLISWL